MTGPQELWEVFVPTVYRVESLAEGSLKYYTTRFHRAWDARVRAITSGLTVFPPVKGQWVAPDGTLFTERMIPVRVAGTREQLERVVELTLVTYDQLAVMAYKISDEVIVRRRNQEVGP